MTRKFLSSDPYHSHEFDLDKNYPLTPDKVSLFSNKKLWWKGSSCEHSWDAVVASRTKAGNKCPICSNQRVLPGYNDLKSNHPEIAAEWDYSKNDLGPDSYASQSNKKVFWKCSRHGHSWEAGINSRFRGRGCPICAGKIVLKGFNDLQSLYPKLSEEWDYSKNSVNPWEVTFGSGKKFWWVCSNFSHHVWISSPSNRTSGKGCPVCSRRGSVIEDTIANLLPDAVQGFAVPVRKHHQKKCIVDIFLEAPKVVVEYDGWFFHRDNLVRDSMKTDALIREGLKVVRIREISNEPLEFLEDREGLYQIQHDINRDSVENTVDILVSLIEDISGDTITNNNLRSK